MLEIWEFLWTSTEWAENSVDLDSRIYLPDVWSVHRLSLVFIYIGTQAIP